MLVEFYEINLSGFLLFEIEISAIEFLQKLPCLSCRIVFLKENLYQNLILNLVSKRISSFRLNQNSQKTFLFKFETEYLGGFQNWNHWKSHRSIWN